jgi:hypothetical protein
MRNNKYLDEIKKTKKNSKFVRLSKAEFQKKLTREKIQDGGLRHIAELHNLDEPTKLGILLESAAGFLKLSKERKNSLRNKGLGTLSSSKKSREALSDNKKKKPINSELNLSNLLKKGCKNW